MGDAPRRRVDPIRGWTSIISPVRATRPFDPEVDPTSNAGIQSESLSECPFCPGNEERLADILAESAAVDPAQPWGSRAVRNRYPFLAPASTSAGEVAGHQEVLIDGPGHEDDPVVQSPGQRRVAVRMWRARVRAALERDPEGEVHLFRNHGRAAGSSRRHPHTQLVQTVAPTPARSAMLGRLAASASCLLCAEPAPDRVVAEGPLWRAWVLGAPLDPGHLRIAPVRHLPSLAEASDEEVDALADLLGPLTAATLGTVGAVAYSLIVHETDPRAGRGAHLHLELRPRVARSAGFEQSSGVGVCSSDPRSDAFAIRRALRASPGIVHPTTLPNLSS